MSLDFTADQRNAIEYKRQDVCVVAGPGSGKTTVLVERYRRLIEEHGFEAREILAITFTEKAAANMKAKVAEKFAGDAFRLRDLEAAWISTIHGFCARFLKENAIAAGIDPRFSVLDARESDNVQMDCLNAALDELVFERRDEALRLMEALKTPRLHQPLKDAYDGIRSAGMTIGEVRKMPSPGAETTPLSVAEEMKEILARWPPRNSLTAGSRARFDLLTEWAERMSDGQLTDWPIDLRSVPEELKKELKKFRDETLLALATRRRDAETAPFREMIFDVLGRFETLYQERKHERGTLDFNDLERRTIAVLSSNREVRSRCAAQFRQVMLDEFQDINQQQAELIRLIRAKDVFFAVGDLNQSIYGFRHARPQIFLDYRAEVEREGKQSTRLLHNFRSRAPILRCVEGLLNSAEGIEAHRLEAAAEFGPKAGSSVEVLRIFDDNDEDGGGMREARWIAHRILHLRRGDIDFRDFAVLCRSHDAMQPILQEFDRIGIPYVCGRRQSFLLSREGLDITALLRTLANPCDTIALATVLRSALVGISDEALMRLKMLGTSVNSGLDLVARDSSKLAEFADGDRVKLQRFVSDLKSWRADQPVVSLELLITRMLSDCGFDRTPGSISGNNTEAFLHAARTAGCDRSLVEFLRELESMESAISAESDLSDEDQGDAVQVLTAHAAKGLEFRITIIAAMHKGTQRSGTVVTFTPEHGIGLRWKDPKNDGGNGLKDSWAVANGMRLKQRETEEENRLLYVAMTRAEQHLILSYSWNESRKPCFWAKRVDEFFDLCGSELSAAPREVTRNEFTAAVLVTNTDPPESSFYAEKDGEAASITAIPRLVVAEQQDTAVNVTSLAVFSNCPRKYYLGRYLGWSDSQRQSFDPEELPGEDANESDPNVSAAELGSSVHELLAGKPGPHPAAAHDLADVFLRSDLGRRAAGAARAEREWEFIADMGGTLVRGSIDLWFEENGKIQLVDYKTDSVARPAEYAPQLALYALAVERAFGQRPAHAYLHFLRPDVVSEVPLDDASLERAAGLIQDLERAQDSLRFDLREGSHCHSCQFYRSLCPAGYQASARKNIRP